MFTAITNFLAGIAHSVGSIFAYKSSTIVQRREAEKDIAAEKKVLDEKKAEIRKAVFENDDEKLNTILNSIMAVCWAVFFVTFFTVTGCLSCATKETVVYIPTDRRIETCTNSIGIVCKAVPNAVFAELVEKVQDLKDLETELKVDKRVGK